MDNFFKQFRAVTAKELYDTLGRGNCSPMKGREGYVIGPDIKGRICHCATCFSMKEAKEKAEEMNKMLEGVNGIYTGKTK